MVLVPALPRSLVLLPYGCEVVTHSTGPRPTNRGCSVHDASIAPLPGGHDTRTPALGQGSGSHTALWGRAGLSALPYEMGLSLLHTVSKPGMLTLPLAPCPQGMPSDLFKSTVRLGSKKQSLIIGNITSFCHDLYRAVLDYSAAPVTHSRELVNSNYKALRVHRHTREPGAGKSPRRQNRAHFRLLDRHGVLLSPGSLHILRAFESPGPPLLIIMVPPQ